MFDHAVILNEQHSYFVTFNSKLWMKKWGVAKYLQLHILTVELLQSSIGLITERLDRDTQEVTRTLKKLALDKKQL